MTNRALGWYGSHAHPGLSWTLGSVLLYLLLHLRLVVCLFAVVAVVDAAAAAVATTSVLKQYGGK